MCASPSSTGTWQELRDVFASHDFTLDTTYAPFSYQHAMRWRAGGWDLVGALQLGSNIRNEALLTATNTSGTLSIGVSAKTTGGTSAIRTRLLYGTGLDYYSLGDQNLEELLPLGNSLYSGATDLDDAGNAVGYSYLNSSEPYYRTQAVLWENDFASGSHPVTAALQLANLPGRNINYPQGYGYARAIDRAGNLIVGQSLGEYPVAGAQPPRTEIRPAATAWVKNLARQTASGTSTAAWETIDLNDQISDKTWQLGNAVDVNTTGIIIGMGLHNGQTRAFLLLPVEISNPKAVNSPWWKAEYGSTDIFDPRNPKLVDEQKAIDSALTIFYNKVRDENNIIEDFDIKLKFGPIDGATWAKVDGPESGTLQNATQPEATYSKPKKGGLYQFDVSFSNQLTRTQVWLPKAGPDISSYWQSEINYFKNTWGPAYRTKSLSRTWFLSPKPSMRLLVIHGLALKDLSELGTNLDWVNPGNGETLKTENSPEGGPPVKSGNEYRYTIKGYVIDFRKRNNMMYALIGKEMTLLEIELRNGPNILGAGSPDSPAAFASYEAGFDLYGGKSLEQTMKDHGFQMQELGSWAQREWPSDEPAIGSLNRKAEIQLNTLIQ